MGDNTKLQDDILARWQQAKDARLKLDTEWKNISENILPDRGRFDDGEFAADQVHGSRGNSMQNSSTTDAHGIAANGMHSGLTPPSRPWFRVVPADRDLLRSSSVKLWFDRLNEFLRRSMAASNFYTSIHSDYSELLGFGTSALMAKPHSKPGKYFRFRVFTAGEYWVTQNDDGEVDTFYRRVDMTSYQMVRKFGQNRVSPQVVQTLDKRRYMTWPVLHVIEPRIGGNPRGGDPKNMPFASLYMEVGSERRILSESGFKRFPIMVGRWNTVGSDVYGAEYPGRRVLPDVRQLQRMELDTTIAIHKTLDPPLRVPVGYQDTLRTFAGGINYVDPTHPEGVSPLYEVNFGIDSAELRIQRIEARIRHSYFNDLFLMMEGLQKGTLTATEVEARQQEKLLQLGPVIDRNEQEKLTPLIEWLVDTAIEEGMFLPPPEEIWEADYEIEYSGPLAQVQRAVANRALEALTAYIANIATIQPQTVDVLDGDASVREYGEAIGVPLAVLRNEEDVDEIRRQRAEEQARMQQAEEAMAAVQGAKDLGAAKTEPGTALGDLIHSLEGGALT